MFEKMTRNEQTRMVAKYAVKVCANRTMSSIFDRMTKGVKVVPFVDSDNPINVIARFVGSEALSLVITKAASEKIDESVDSVCDMVENVKKTVDNVMEGHR